MISTRAFCVLAFSALLHGAAWEAGAAQLEVFDSPGVVLRGNPLGDPASRHVAVFLPDGVSASIPLPLVVYLPGWGSSSEDAIAQGATGWLGHALDRLAADGLAVRLAVVDGRSRYGGSQFLNSTATGNYADYVSEEIVPALNVRYALQKDARIPCVIAGHSSGGYGAMVLAMARPAIFGAVAALSPDSDFETTHKPLAQHPSVRALTRSELDAATGPPGRAILPADGLARLVIGLCANYAPIPKQPRRFEWLYDDLGDWREAAWQRWLDLDPLTVVRRDAGAFAPTQRIYLDGAQYDEFGANIGARKIHEVLRTRKSAVTFYESPDHHGDHLSERLARGLLWVFGKRVPAGL